MNIYDQKLAKKELSPDEWKELEDIHPDAPIRYGYYRRHYPIDDKEQAMSAARDWGRNQ